MKQKIIKGFFPILLVFFILIPSFRIVSAQEDETIPVNILFLYSPDCFECVSVLAKDIPDVVNQYGDQVKILSVDITKPGNQQIYMSLVEKFELKDKPLPIVIVGESVFVGIDKIRAGVPSKIQELIEVGGVNLPFGNEVPPESDRSLPFIMVVFLVVLATFAIGWGRTNNLLSKLREEKKKVDNENTQFRSTIFELEQNLEDQKRRLIGQGTTPFSDPTLNALIGLGSSPVDYLSEAMRILYFQDKRSADATVRDVNGFLSGLLKTISAAKGIESIGYYYQEVDFSSRYHTCSQPVSESEDVKVRVVEAGWKKNETVLKKAIVEKLRKG